jgi:4-amino-4-deoxy-L-arabinose transferase-like glycosyltransferase
MSTDIKLILFFSLITVFIHLWSNAFIAYGIFRDELYYIACSNHLALGYVDQPPLSIYLLYVSRVLFGDSLFALRLFPAVTGGLIVFMTGQMVRKLEGGRTALIIALIAITVAPFALAASTYFSMNCFDGLFWVLAAYILILICKGCNPRLWLLLGLVIGLGLLNKISMAWFAIGLAAALLLTRQRKHLATKWPYLAGLIAFIVFSPYILWNVMNQFAHLEFIHNATTLKYNTLNRLDFLLGQLQVPNPLTLPLWLAGLYYYFFNRNGKQFRPLGIIYITSFMILLINGHSKSEYLAWAYPMLFAAGAILIEQISQKKFLVWLKYALPAGIALSGLLIAPYLIPLLPVKTYIGYTKALGISVESSEGKKLSQLHQFYADMFGWEKMAAAIARVYNTLSPGEKAKCAICVNNYGEAGAIDFYGETYHLPKAICGHNNYWLWGPRDATGDVIIRLGGTAEDLKMYYKEAIPVGIFQNEYCMPYENNLPIFLCRGRNKSLQADWAEFKHYE